MQLIYLTSMSYIRFWSLGFLIMISVSCNSEAKFAENGGEKNSAAADNAEGKNEEVNNKPVVESPTVLEPDPLALGAACEQQDLVITLDQDLLFPEPTETCAWSDGANPGKGNLAAEDGILTARREQSRQLLLPDDAMLCSLKMDFVNNNKDGQKMYYDDEIFLTVNDVVLIASESFDDRLVKEEGFLIYDWAKLSGTNYTHDGGLYCAGQATGEGVCSVPKTQASGEITMKFDDALMRKIGLLAGVGFEEQQQSDKLKGTGANNNLAVKFITLGDNDAPADCKHSVFNVKVTASYVLSDSL